MPIAQISILEGRAPELKARMIEKVALALSESLDVPIDSVRVLVQEYPASLWSVGTRTMAQRRTAPAGGTHS